jgi:hypothetical protein
VINKGILAFMWWVISDDDMLDTKFMTVMIGFILVFLYSNPFIRFLISDNTIFLFGLGKSLLAILLYYAQFMCLALVLVSRAILTIANS